MAKQFGLQTLELIQSFSTNGYFEEEPLICIPEASNEYIVVEGNRRLAALKLLLDPTSAQKNRIALPPEAATRLDELKKVPILIYDSRKDILPYLGFRHITGVKSWGSSEKALYIKQLTDSGYSPEEIGNIVGDQHLTVVRMLESYRVLDQSKELGFDEENTYRFYFSYLFTALQRVSIRNFLGLPPERVTTKNPIPMEKAKRELLQVMSWLFGDKGESKPPVIAKAAEINDYLGPVIEFVEARTILRNSAGPSTRVHQDRGRGSSPD